MIAFYTWTDTQILNALNLKTGTFPQEEADLFVLELARVSQPLLEQVRRQGVFRRIVRIPEPTDGRTGFVHVLAKLFSGLQYHAAFRSSVDLVPGEQYRLLITGGFWSYTVFLYRMLAKANPQLEVAFLEEGIASYDGASVLYWCDPKSKLRSALMHLMFYPGMVNAAKRATKTLYLYCPEACMNRGQLAVLPMGPYTPQTLAVLQALGAHTDLDAYRTRPVIFFLQPEPDDELRNAVLLTMIETKKNLLLVLLQILPLTLLVFLWPVSMFAVLLVPVAHVLLSTMVTLPVLQARLVHPDEDPGTQP